MADQDAILRQIILDLVPPDGSTIGNQALLTLLQDRIPTVTEEAYQAARDALVEEGILDKGRGRGGSVHLVVDDEGDEDDDGFALDEAEEDQTPRRSTSSRTRRRDASGPAQVLSYRHEDKRLNNPEVGLVHPENDPDAGKTRWAYDPHIDPALQFDSARARIETLIDDALASGDAETMREALAELKRLQAPYLNWTGKAERTSFEVDTVSLHVHERIDPASILRACLSASLPPPPALHWNSCKYHEWPKSYPGKVWPPAPMGHCPSPPLNCESTISGHIRARTRERGSRVGWESSWV